MRIVVVAPNASSRFGGEAFIPLNYFRLLRHRKMDVRLVVHARNRDELTEQLPLDPDRLYFVEDTFLHKALFKIGGCLPEGLAESTTGLLIHLSTQRSQRQVLQRIAKTAGIDVIHVPIPVSPKNPSVSWGLDAAVVIGPLNGGMEYPKAFQKGLVSRLSVLAGRWLATFANTMFRGKREADLVLVANQRTREALPSGIKGQIVELVENGADFSVWQRTNIKTETRSTARFIFVGRLIDWKAVDIVLEAMHRLEDEVSISFEIVGDGAMRQHWQALAERLGLCSSVQFSGWMSQKDCARRLEQADVLVLPSLFECGGAVVLEAMAMGLPVIATAWGGPLDYLDETCGILVKPDSREALIAGFARAMAALACSDSLRHRLGQAGHARARQHFDWDRKTDRLVELYQLAATRKAKRL